MFLYCCHSDAMQWVTCGFTAAQCATPSTYAILIPFFSFSLPPFSFRCLFGVGRHRSDIFQFVWFLLLCIKLVGAQEEFLWDRLEWPAICQAAAAQLGPYVWHGLCYAQSWIQMQLANILACVQMDVGQCVHQPVGIGYGTLPGAFDCDISIPASIWIGLGDVGVIVSIPQLWNVVVSLGSSTDLAKFLERILQ